MQYSPIGDDGQRVELHHRNQNPDGPIDEMTRRDHRGPGNHGRNHPLPNQGVDHGKDWDNYRRRHWEKEWDSGRFDDLPERRPLDEGRAVDMTGPIMVWIFERIAGRFFPAPVRRSIPGRGLIPVPVR